MFDTKILWNAYLEAMIWSVIFPRSLSSLFRNGISPLHIRETQLHGWWLRSSIQPHILAQENDCSQQKRSCFSLSQRQAEEARSILPFPSRAILTKSEDVTEVHCAKFSLYYTCYLHHLQAPHRIRALQIHYWSRWKHKANRLIFIVQNWPCKR